MRRCLCVAETEVYAIRFGVLDVRSLPLIKGSVQALMVGVVFLFRCLVLKCWTAHKTAAMSIKGRFVSDLRNNTLYCHGGSTALV